MVGSLTEWRRVHQFIRLLDGRWILAVSKRSLVDWSLGRHELPLVLALQETNVRVHADVGDGSVKVPVLGISNFGHDVTVRR